MRVMHLDVNPKPACLSHPHVHYCSCVPPSPAITCRPFQWLFHFTFFLTSGVLRPLGSQVRVWRYEPTGHELVHQGLMHVVLSLTFTHPYAILPSGHCPVGHPLPTPSFHSPARSLPRGP